MLRSGAWRYRPGPRGNFALMEFVAQLNRLATAVSGVELTFSVYPDPSGSGQVGTTYGGTLFHVMQLLQPALPRMAGSIAELSPSAIGARLRAIHAARSRPGAAPIR